MNPNARTSLSIPRIAIIFLAIALCAFPWLERLKLPRMLDAWNNLDLPDPDLGLPVEVGPDDLDAFGLLQRLQTRHSLLHVVATNWWGTNHANGYYLCEGPRRWESLSDLTRSTPSKYERWAGVVLVQHRRRDCRQSMRQLQEWGSHCLLTRQLVLFGDPRLLARIREELLD